MPIPKHYKLKLRIQFHHIRACKFRSGICNSTSPWNRPECQTKCDLLPTPTSVINATSRGMIMRRPGTPTHPRSQSISASASETLDHEFWANAQIGPVTRTFNRQPNNSWPSFIQPRTETIQTLTCSTHPLIHNERCQGWPWMGRNKTGGAACRGNGSKIICSISW